MNALGRYKMDKIKSNKYNAANTISACNAGYLNSAITEINAVGGVLLPVGGSPADQWGVGADLSNGYAPPPADYTGEWIFDGIPRGGFWGIINNPGIGTGYWEVVHQGPLHDVADRCAVITYDTITNDMLYVGTTTEPSTEAEAAEQVMGARTYNCTPYISGPGKSWCSTTYTYGQAHGVCAIGAVVNGMLPVGSVTCKAGICFDDGNAFTLPEAFRNFPDGTQIVRCLAHVNFANFRCTSTTLSWHEGGGVETNQLVLDEVDNASVAVYSMRMRADGTTSYQCLGTISGQKISADCWVDITSMAQTMFAERSEALGYMVFPCAGEITPELDTTDFRGLLESFMVQVTGTFGDGIMTDITSEPAIWYEWGLGGCVTEMHVTPSYPDGVVSETNQTAFIATDSADSHIGQPVFPPMN